MTQTVGIIGAGTMGAGIAQVAAVRGWNAHLMDVDPSIVNRAIDSIRESLSRRVDTGKMTASDRDAAVQRLSAAGEPSAFHECELVIEAVIEDLAIKQQVLAVIMPALTPKAIIATNTSSLSVTKIGESINQPARTLGMHFFNPPPVMPLVEIIRGEKTEPAAVDRAAAIAREWGKTVVFCRDTPGFIVNRVARPYYLEAFRIVEDGFTNVDEVDSTMKALGGFKMGPFELTDLIGQDVNAATTQSIWEQLGKPPRLKPSELQKRLVKAGHLGRKTGRGVYIHDREPRVAGLQIDRRSLEMNDRLHEAVDQFVSRASSNEKRTTNNEQRYIFARILVSIINEAAWAFTERVASAADINTALKLGTNYPKGPLEWAEEIGYSLCGELLDALNASVVDKRFAAPAMLKARV